MMTMFLETISIVSHTARDAHRHLNRSAKGFGSADLERAKSLLDDLNAQMRPH